MPLAISILIQNIGKCYQGSQGDHKGGDGSKAHALGGQVGDDSGQDGQDAIPECRHWERDPDPLWGEAVALWVLVNIPVM